MQDTVYSYEVTPSYTTALKACAKLQYLSLQQGLQTPSRHVFLESALDLDTAQCRKDMDLL